MKKILIATSALIAAASFNTTAHSATYNVVSGSIIEKARGGANNVEFGQQSDGDVVNNNGVDFDVAGFLGNGYADFFTFTMDKAFDMTLDLFVATNTADATYEFTMTGQSGLQITTPQTGYALYSNLTAGTYTFGITSPNSRKASYDISVSAVPLPTSLPLYGAGLAALGFVGWRKKQKAAAAA